MSVYLPEGWTHSESAFNGIRYIVIERPGVGGATVDLTKRCFRGGFGNVFGKAENTAAYTGRGWRDRLVADAVKWLGAL